MATTIKVDDTEFRQLLKNHDGFVSRTMPELVRKYSRIACVELANRTQPFSVGGAAANAKKLGEEATSKGINTVIAGKEWMRYFADRSDNESIRERLQSLAAANDVRGFAAFLRSVGMNVPVEVISSGEIGKVHNNNRNKRTGRTFKRIDKIYLTKSGLDSYVKKVVRRVGLSKSGWADAARKIGGVKGDGARGIPAFAKAKRHKSAGGITDRTKDKSNPRVDMQNDTPWVSRICPRSEQLIALQIARDKMIKEADMRLKSAAKNKFEESTQ
jgi:hypothetical protein